MARARKILASSVEAGRAWVRYYDTKSQADLRRAQDLERAAHEERLLDPETVREEYELTLTRRIWPLREV